VEQVVAARAEAREEAREEAPAEAVRVVAPVEEQAVGARVGEAAAEGEPWEVPTRTITTIL